MRAILLLFSFSLLFLLNGCLEIVTLVRVTADGSGTVEETVLINKDIVNMIREFADAMPAEEGEEKQEFNLFDEEELRSQASSFGTGVEYLSGNEISNESKEGFTAVYSFTDLNSLILNQNPNSKIPLGAVDNDDDEVMEELVKFNFSKDNVPEITINFIDMKEEFDVPEEDTSAIIPDSALADTTFNEVAKLMRDMKITLAVEPEGDIIETNATHVSGNRITLFDIDFNELLSNEQKFEEFKKIQPQSFEEFKKIVKDIPGIKVEFNQPVIIKFQ